MDSTESSYVSSPEAPRKRSPAPTKSPTSDTVEKPSYIRFLVSNTAAGSVIGKGGSTISDFQSQTGARIQLSRNYEFFPGTTDRIIMVSGTLNEILKAVDLILAKLLSELIEFPVGEGADAEPKTRVRLVVPHTSCGGIIGKGGSTIKSLIVDSHASINISSREDNYFGLSDRLVTLIGTVDEQMRAIDKILSKLVGDPHYSQPINSPFSYPGVFSYGFHGIPSTYMLPSVATAAHNPVNYIPNGTGGKYQNTKMSSTVLLPQEDRGNTVTIGIADGHIGIIVGRGGRNIMEITQATGARIKISNKGDYMSGTTDRKVTITGSQRAIDVAESMIMQKVAYASERTMD